MSIDIFNNLNSVQKEAVEKTEGALLVLAGAGTGKTKVLTTRIVNIINKRLARGSEILAVTFTNKAAKEMKERVEALLGYQVDGFWIGTFHSIGLRILRRHVTEVGLKSNFTILDTGDSERVLKDILVAKNVDTKKFPPVMVLNAIARLKDKNILSDNVPHEENKLIGNVKIATIYEAYQSRLRELNVVDFGDLILLCVDLFRQFPDILNLWQEKFKYVLVDEFQDTNILQYVFIRLLSLKYRNLCCVGDDDQSIYSWRGAEISNILRFEEDYTGASVLRLEQNYRSTTPILSVASSLIAKNKDRWGKTLWTQNEGELPVKVYEAINAKMEAEFISNKIEELLRKGVKYNDMAILVRASFQTRELEERLKFNAIPYRFVGGTEFYNREEIRDVIAYLRLLHQKYDDMAFLRIINKPKRSLGDASIEKIRVAARDNNLSLFEAAERIAGKKILATKADSELQNFITLFNNWFLLKEKKLAEITKTIVEESGYLFMWKSQETEEAKGRIENIKELYMALEGYESLEDFLEYVALVNDKEDDLGNNDKVSVMTLHGAKGLEFNVVFLAGWEEGILPNQRSLEESGEKGLQEERRLAYVGITRAKKDLYISYALNRQMYGNWQSSIASRFINEIDKKHVEILKGSADRAEAYKDKFLKEKLYNNMEKTFSSEGFSNSGSLENKLFIKQGVRVKHNTMGEGIVLAVQGPVVDVKFDSGDSKKIMVSFLKLLSN